MLIVFPMFVLIIILCFILTGFKSGAQLPKKTHLTTVYGSMCQTFTTSSVVCIHIVFVRRSCQ